VDVRILVFGTSYCASPTRLRLLDQWAEALQRIAPTVDQLIVDSQSPVFDTSSHNFLRPFGERHICPSDPTLFAVRHRTIVSFPENLGQLERGGRDGWGRAFSQGLLCGIAGGYDYVVHVEGDMLTRLDIPRVCGTMAAAPMPWSTRAATRVAVVGARPHSSEAVVNVTRPVMNSRR